MATISVSEASYRRYGRANYDVTPRLHHIGDELFIQTRGPLDNSDLEYVNSRVARGTYSQQSKAFPRCGSSSSSISVVIASQYPPHCDVSKKQLQDITDRLTRPTCGSKLKRTERSQSAPLKKETPSPSSAKVNVSFALSNKSSQNRSFDRSFTRMTSANSSFNQSSRRDSFEKDRSSNRSSTSSSRALKGLPTSPKIASNGTIAAFSVYPVFEPIVVPRPCKRPIREKFHTRKPVTIPNPPKVVEKQKKAPKKVQKNATPAKSSSQGDSKPKRLGLIATILETVDECDMM